MAREEIGLQPCSKVKLHHVQQDFDTISSEVFFFPLHFSHTKKKISYQGRYFEEALSKNKLKAVGVATNSSCSPL